MKNRISYYEHPYKENYFISFREYQAPDTVSRYEVHLDLKNMMFLIKRLNDDRFIFKSNVYTNLVALKRAARNFLCKRLKIKLEKEVRHRSFGLCEKGYTQEKHERLKGLS